MQKAQLTIATYNIQFGKEREKIIKNIEKMANDGVMIFCLQEIINISDKEFIIDQIIRRLGSHWKAAYHVGDELSRESIGTAILWNAKIVSIKHQEKILLPKIASFDIHEKMYYRVVGAPGIPLQRRALTCYFSFNQIVIRITCVHVDNVGGPKQRIRQISYLISQLRSFQPPNHEIICGDFNTFDLLKTDYEKNLLQDIIGKEFIDASKKVGWTADIHNIDFTKSIKIFPWLINTFNVHVRRRLDYIWVKNFEVLECKKLELLGSDHFPVIAKLILK